MIRFSDLSIHLFIYIAPMESLSLLFLCDSVSFSVWRVEQREKNRDLSVDILISIAPMESLSLFL